MFYKIIKNIMQGKITATIHTNTPTVVGWQISGNIQMPYMLQYSTNQTTERIDKKTFLDFIKTLWSFWIWVDKTGLWKSSKQSSLDFFKDRIFVACSQPTLSEFFSTLSEYMNSKKPLPQYVTQFILSLNRQTQSNLLQFTAENVELIASIVDNVDYREEGQLLESKSKFMESLEDIDEELLQISPNMNVPVLPGNSIRWLMRDKLMNYVIQKLYWESPHKILNVRQYHILFSGWLLVEWWWYDNIDYKAKLREKLPFLSILGSMLGNEDLPGKIKVDFAVLQCKETEKNDRYAISYLNEYFGTRMDDYEWEITEDLEKWRSCQMIFSKMFIQAGATLDWWVSYYNLSELEKSFLDLWLKILKDDWKLWGVTRIWYWDVNINYESELDESKAIDYLENNAEDIRQFISELK